MSINLYVKILGVYIFNSFFLFIKFGKNFVADLILNNFNFSNINDDLNIFLFNVRRNIEICF